MSFLHYRPLQGYLALLSFNYIVAHNDPSSGSFQDLFRSLWVSIRPWCLVHRYFARPGFSCLPPLVVVEVQITRRRRSNVPWTPMAEVVVQTLLVRSSDLGCGGSLLFSQLANTTCVPCHLPLDSPNALHRFTSFR